MNRNKLLFVLLSTVLICELMFFLYTPLIGANSTVPEEYSKDFELNDTYIYNVSKFDSKLNWYGIDWSSRGWCNTSKGGQIIVNFTGFYEKHPNDFSPFSSPTPYLNISFFEYISDTLVLNTTFSNVSSYEAANALAIGYNEFDPGFLIPTKDFDQLAQGAYAQNQSGFWEAEIQAIEYLKTIKFFFQKSDNSQNTTVIYDKKTGVLVWAKVENSYGPDLEISLLGYELTMSKFNPDDDDSDGDDDDDDDDENILIEIPSYPLVILGFLIIGSSLMLVLKIRKKNE